MARLHIIGSGYRRDPNPTYIKEPVGISCGRPEGEAGGCVDAFELRLGHVQRQRAT